MRLRDAFTAMQTHSIGVQRRGGVAVRDSRLAPRARPSEAAAGGPGSVGLADAVGTADTGLRARVVALEALLPYAP